MNEQNPTIYANPDLLKQAEDLYFALSNNITIAGKSVVFHIIESAKKYYRTSAHKKEWDRILIDLGNIINDFENGLPDQSEVKLFALQRNLDDLVIKESQQTN